MLDWIFKLIFKKRLRELDKISDNLAKMIKEAEDAKYFALRNNVVSVPFMDMNSSSFRTEISSMWKSEDFQFLLHVTRNELITELIRGGEPVQRNVQGMLKGIETIAIKMQEISRSTEQTVRNEEV